MVIHPSAGRRRSGERASSPCATAAPAAPSGSASRLERVVVRPARAVVLRNTVLEPVPGLDGVVLYLADDALTVWRAVQLATGDPDTPLPYWAFAWGGGLAIAHYLQERPAIVAGRRVLDLGSGSGLCAIVASAAGAAAVTAVDIDPLAIAAIGLNARANGRRVGVVRRDLLDEPPPDDVDVILAGDCWYEAALAERVTHWLRAADAAGIDVLVGDPGRRFLPLDELEQLATYDVRTTTELEDLDRRSSRVYRFGSTPRR